MLGSLATVGRSLFESLIATYWASLSDSNAKDATEFETLELRRIIRNNLRWCRAQILHKQTGSIETDRILNHPEIQKAKRLKRFDDMAKDAEIKNIYDNLYGFLSLLAHGTAMDMILKSQREEQVYAIMSLVRGCLKSIHLIAVNRIREGKPTPRTALEEILKVKLSS